MHLIIFQKDNFAYSGGYLTYDNKFIARFKYSSRDKAGFISFLVKNFSVEEYFAEYAANVAPALILEKKGYISATVKQVLKRTGYEPTLAGKNQYVTDSVAKYATA